MSLDTDINIAEATADIDTTMEKVDAFVDILSEKVDDAVRDVAKEFRDEVKKHIRASGIERDTGELLSSWKVTPTGVAQYRVHSTADHAIFLEVGTEPHTISGNRWLKFQPENPGEYPERRFWESKGELRGDFAEDGLVVDDLDPLADAEPGTYFAKSVQHPGNKEYAYFRGAQAARDWQEMLDSKIERAIEEARAEVGL